MFTHNPAHQIGTCAKCGEEMIFNVPRLGANGGYIHKSSNKFDCNKLMETLDHSLQLAIARELPGLIQIVLDEDGNKFYWVDGKIRSDHFVGKTGTQTPILDTEWDHIILRLIEPKMTLDEVVKYLDLVRKSFNKKLVSDFDMMGATFNQRAGAWCKLKST